MAMSWWAGALRSVSTRPTPGRERGGSPAREGAGGGVPRPPCPIDRLREATRCRTTSPTPLSVTDISFRLIPCCFGTFLTNSPRSIVILSHYGDERRPPKDRNHHQRPQGGRLLRPL